MRTISGGSVATPSDAAAALRSAATGHRQLHAIIDLAEGWDAAARCRGEDAALFFGPGRFEPKAERVAREAQAKAICEGCPALQPCREQSLTNGEPYGVWGGLSESDRRALLEQAGVALRAG